MSSVADDDRPTPEVPGTAEPLSGVVRALRGRLTVRVGQLPDGEPVRVAASGELDLDTADVLRDILHRAIAAGPARIDLDLGRVTFCDAYGVNTVLQARSLAAHHRGELVVTRTSAAVERILRLIGEGEETADWPDP